MSITGVTVTPLQALNGILTSRALSTVALPITVPVQQACDSITLSAVTDQCLTDMNQTTLSREVHTGRQISPSNFLRSEIMATVSAQPIQVPELLNEAMTTETVAFLLLSALLLSGLGISIWYAFSKRAAGEGGSLSSKFHKPPSPEDTLEQFLAQVGGDDGSPGDKVSMGVLTPQEGMAVLKLWAERQAIQSQEKKLEIALVATELRVGGPALYSLESSQNTELVRGREEAILARTHTFQDETVNPLPTVGDLSELVLRKKMRSAGLQIVTHLGTASARIKSNNVILQFEQSPAWSDDMSPSLPERLRQLGDEATRRKFNFNILYEDVNGERKPVFKRSK